MSGETENLKLGRGLFLSSPLFMTSYPIPWRYRIWTMDSAGEETENK